MSQAVIIEVRRAGKSGPRRILIPVSSILYIEEAQPAVIVMRTARIEVVETYEQIRQLLGGRSYWSDPADGRLPENLFEDKT